ncbi:hypothetical protein Btru_054148 [Bulinus truncatus]|nr:hypothetical protein Btru_054148 [Bulinus truncatus]
MPREKDTPSVLLMPREKDTPSVLLMPREKDTPSVLLMPREKDTPSVLLMPREKDTPSVLLMPREKDTPSVLLMPREKDTPIVIIIKPVIIIKGTNKYKLTQKMLFVLIGLIHTCNLVLASPPLTSPPLSSPPLISPSLPGQPLLLTEYINTKNIKVAKDLSLVTGTYCNMPRSYSGYLTVDRDLKKHLFFWFFPSRLDKSTSPLVIWLNGGPTRSSLIGLLWENGPLEIVPHKNGSVGCKRRKISWADDMSMLYIDGPVGTGFSYAETEAGHSKICAGDHGKDLCNFLHQFRRLFPEFKRRDLYIGGEGYAAKFVISFAHRLLRSRRKIENSKLPFSGVYLSGPFFAPEIQLRSASDALFSVGAISHKEMMDHRQRTKNFFNSNRNNNHNGSLTLDQLMSIIQKRQPPDNYALKKFIKFPIIDKLINENLKQYLHVRGENFACCGNGRARSLPPDFVSSVKDQLADIMNVSKVLVFSGEFDAVFSPAMVDYGLMSTPWRQQHEFNSSIRNEWKLDRSLKGYFTRVGQLCRVVIAGAGHMTSLDEPESTRKMMSEFIKSGCVSSN